MSVSWNKKYDPTFIVEDIKRIRTLDANGKVSFKGFKLQEIRAILFSAVQFRIELPQTEKIALLSKAVYAAAANKNMSVDHLKAEMSRGLRSWQKRSKKRYRLATSLSFRYAPEIGSKRMGGAGIRFHKHFPKSIDRKAWGSISIDRDAKPNLKEGQFARVLVSVSAKSPMEATSIALDALGLLRGIWNLRLNLPIAIRSSMHGPKQPVNEIRLGRVHTLHKPNGKPATMILWYEPDFALPVMIKDLRSSMAELDRFEQRVRTKLRRNPHREFIEDAIRRYCRALDEKKLDNAFLKLWAVLEAVTGTLEHRYDRTIRRATFLWPEPKRHRQVLEHLRDHRNRAIHHTESP